VLAREDRADGAVQAAVIRASIAHHLGDRKRRDEGLADAEARARIADMRTAQRMIARTRARLDGDEARRAEHDTALLALGVVDPESFARFITPGLHPRRTLLPKATSGGTHA
jgi:hypothetical protein